MVRIGFKSKVLFCLYLLICVLPVANAFDIDHPEKTDMETQNVKQDKVAKKNEPEKFLNASYTINAGDVLEINVWREKDLDKEVTVRPDGAVSIPLVGEIIAKGKTIAELQKLITNKLEKFIPDPVVTVTTKAILGNKVYVVGNVNRPGEIIMNQRINVIQALGIAGGTNAFADLNDIKILRRVDSNQVAIPVKAQDIESGKNLKQNITLLSGDVLVVP